MGASLVRTPPAVFSERSTQECGLRRAGHFWCASGALASASPRAFNTGAPLPLALGDRFVTPSKEARAEAVVVPQAIV